jgi:phosphatidylglycerophosphatase A
MAGLNIVLFVVGVWASSRTCRISGLKDPQKVVIDEVSGQLIALVPVALSPAHVPVIAAFALFRLFDIFKPYPIRKLESLPGGLGVMADDALAGLYAAALIWIGRLLHLF